MIGIAQVRIVFHTGWYLPRGRRTATAAKALESTGGSGYLRPSGIERLLRDAYAAQFHPLQEKKQQEFTGRITLGLDPIG